MSADSDVSPQASYIQHHLVHYNNLGEKQSLIADFSVINYDSIFWAILTGAIAVLVMWLAARRATAGVPGRFQGFVEMHQVVLYIGGLGRYVAVSRHK